MEMTRMSSDAVRSMPHTLMTGFPFSLVYASVYPTFTLVSPSRNHSVCVTLTSDASSSAPASDGWEVILTDTLLIFTLAVEPAAPRLNSMRPFASS